MITTATSCGCWCVRACCPATSCMWQAPLCASLLPCSVGVGARTVGACMRPLCMRVLCCVCRCAGDHLGLLGQSHSGRTPGAGAPAAWGAVLAAGTGPHSHEAPPTAPQPQAAGCGRGWSHCDATQAILQSRCLRAPLSIAAAPSCRGRAIGRYTPSDRGRAAVPKGCVTAAGLPQPYATRRTRRALWKQVHVQAQYFARAPSSIVHFDDFLTPEVPVCPVMLQGG